MHKSGTGTTFYNITMDSENESEKHLSGADGHKRTLMFFRIKICVWGRDDDMLAQMVGMLEIVPVQAGG